MSNYVSAFTDEQLDDVRTLALYTATGVLKRRRREALAAGDSTRATVLEAALRYQAADANRRIRGTR